MFFGFSLCGEPTPLHRKSKFKKQNPAQKGSYIIVTPSKTSRLSIAPMMDWTDRHYRYFARRFSKNTELYSEMITTQAILFGDVERLLGYHQEEHPLVLQLGGSNPEQFAKACCLAKPFGYNGINLNAGCPSERVSAGSFGASLRQNNSLIAECLTAIKENSDVPVSIKTRIALEEMTPEDNGYEDLCRFGEMVKKTGCQEIIIHARKARLKGFTPKQNRERLALNYDLVYQFKKDFPDFFVSINGNITCLEDALEHLKYVDGVMIGRAAYANPSLLSQADKLIFNKDVEEKSSVQAIYEMLPYLEQCMQEGIRPHSVTRHWLGLFKGYKNASLYRKTLSQMTTFTPKDFKTVAQLINNVISSF